MSVSFNLDVFLSNHLEQKAFSVVTPIHEPGEIALAISSKAPKESSFFYAKVPAEDTRSAWALEECGFRLVDTLLLYRRELGSAQPVSANILIRSAIPDDLASLGRIARTSFEYSRFHRDPHIPQQKANSLKEAWIGNYFNGSRGDVMFVAQIDGKLGGFLLLLQSDHGLAIDLIAVAPSLRRRSIGSALISHAISEYEASGHILAGTQAVNKPSIRLYQSMAFVLFDCYHTFHLHKSVD